MIINGHDLPDLPQSAGFAKKLGSRSPEDDAQDAYVRFLKYPADEMKGPTISWFWRLLRHVVIDKKRSCFVSRSVPIICDFNSSDQDILISLINKELVSKTMTICNGTSRMIEMLASGDTYADIAKKTGMTKGSIKSKIHHARKKCIEAT